MNEYGETNINSLLNSERPLNNYQEDDGSYGYQTQEFNSEGELVAAAEAGADVLLAASVFHFHVIGIPELKAFLAGRGLPVHV